MIKEKDIATAFKSVKKQHLSLIQSIKESKIADIVRQNLTENKTRICFRLLGSLTNSKMEVLTDIVEQFSLKHELEFTFTTSETSAFQIKDGLAFNLILLDDFNAESFIINNDQEYVLFVKDDIQLSPSIKTNRKIHVSLIKNNNTVQSFVDFLNSSPLLKKVYKAKEAYIHKEMNIVYKVLRRRNTILSGNVILNKGKEISLMSNSAKALSIEGNRTKQLLNAKIKSHSYSIENKLDEIFSAEHPDFNAIITELNEYVGYNESPKGKIVTYSYPPEYIVALKEKCIATSLSVFKETIELGKKSIQETESTLINKMEIDEETESIFPDVEVEMDNFKKNLTSDVETIKNEDRKASYQGMSAIFSALKTPIYALFPLIMIARFIPSSDVGEIDHSIKMFENQSVVAVSKMPDTYDKSVTKFITAINNSLENGDLINRDTGKDVFKYSLDDKGRKTVEYSTLESGTQTPYVILPVYSDREMATQILMDNVLTIQMRLNIVAEVKKIPKILGPFERFFGPLLLLLIIWFIYSKRKSMFEQNEATQKTETAELNNNKLSELQSFIKSSESSAKAELKIFFKDYIEQAISSLDLFYSEQIQKEEKNRAKQMKLFKSREQTFQSEIKNIYESQRKIYDVGKEYYKQINSIV